MHVPTPVRQLGWFVALWAAGVGTILLIGLAIRMVLMPG